MPQEVITLLVFLVMAVGLVGAVLPGLPGLPLIFIAALVHKLFFPEVTSWWLVAFLAVMAVAGVVVDFLSGWAGARMFGASKWGMIGALMGLLFVIPFSLPGLIFGPIVSAICAEIVMARRTLKEASKSGAGAGVGFLLSAVAHLIMGLVMIGAFTVALFVK